MKKNIVNVCPLYINLNSVAKLVLVRFPFPNAATIGFCNFCNLAPVCCAVARSIAFIDAHCLGIDVEIFHFFLLLQL